MLRIRFSWIDFRERERERGRDDANFLRGDSKRAKEFKNNRQIIDFIARRFRWSIDFGVNKETKVNTS